MEKIVTGSQESRYLPTFLAGDRLLLIVYGDVTAGIDLAALDVEAVEVSGPVITMTLPSPDIFSTRIDNARIARGLARDRPVRRARIRISSRRSGARPSVRSARRRSTAASSRRPRPTRARRWRRSSAAWVSKRAIPLEPDGGALREQPPSLSRTGRGCFARATPVHASRTGDGGALREQPPSPVMHVCISISHTGVRPCVPDRHLLACLTAAVVAASPQANPYLGKWNMTGTGADANNVYWLEIKDDGGTADRHVPQPRRQPEPARPGDGREWRAHLQRARARRRAGPGISREARGRQTRRPSS